MDTIAPDTDLYLYEQERDALAAHIADIAEYVTGNYLQLTTASMATILNAIDADGGTVPDALTRVFANVERVWDECRFATAEAASLECCTRPPADH